MNAFDFYIICNNCKTPLKNESEENSCNYWFHQTKHYGNSLLFENYCELCITKHVLYDGRVDSLCKQCQRYANVFLLYPEFLEVCIFLFREADGLDVREITENEELIKLFSQIDDGNQDLGDIFGNCDFYKITYDIKQNSVVL